MTPEEHEKAILAQQMHFMQAINESGMELDKKFYWFQEGLWELIGSYVAAFAKSPETVVEVKARIDKWIRHYPKDDVALTARDYFATHATELDIESYMSATYNDVPGGAAGYREQARYAYADIMMLARKPKE